MVPVIGNGNDNGLGLEFRRVGDPASSIQHPESSIQHPATSIGRVGELTTHSA